MNKEEEWDKREEELNKLERDKAKLKELEETQYWREVFWNLRDESMDAREQAYNHAQTVGPQILREWKKQKERNNGRV